MHAINPPFRADHVGSLLRPPQLKEARQRAKQGAITNEELRRVEDDAIRDIVRVLWTPAGFLRTLRVCRLYDYGCHRWIDYDGTALSEPLLPPPTVPPPVPATPAEAVAPIARATEHQEGTGQPN